MRVCPNCNTYDVKYHDCEANKREREQAKPIPSAGSDGSTAGKFERDCERWQKKYGCTLGREGSWCDGKKAKRCPNVLVTGGAADTCELHL